MIFKTEAQLTAEINRLTDQLHEVRAQNGKDFLEEDLGLQSAVSELARAYERRDWLKMKNAAAYVMEIHIDNAPDMPDPVREWEEISAPNFGVGLPPNWNMPKDIVMPRGKFTILGAKQKTGKTRGALSITLHLADKGHCVSFASGEMYPSEIWLLLWMQNQFIERGQSYGYIQARMIMASKEIKWHEVRQSFHDFRRKYADKIAVIYTAGWTARRILYGHKLMENIFGKPPTCRVTDYAQIIQPEGQFKDIRQAQINNSQLLTIACGLSNTADILISQLNEAGATAESQQYEKDAGMVINLIREEDKDTGEKSPEIKIHVKHSRSTPSGLFTRWMDVKSGAIVPSAGYTPPDAQRSFND